MAAISAAKLTKVYANQVRALDGVDLSIGDGEFFALLGPSGCGKTTMLRTLAGLEVPSGGTIRMDGKDVTRLPPGKRNVGMVFQDYALYPHMDVADNIAYPLKIKRMNKAARRTKATETGSHLGLDGLMDRKPGQLSGGQQQRVALARAVASGASVLFMDEPLSNLDARLRMEARTFLKRLHMEVGTTTVYVTHDQSEALALADHVAVMDRGQIRQLGTPSEVFHWPANLFVARFIGNTPMNLFPGVVRDGRLTIGDQSAPLLPGIGDLVADGDEVVLAARPEYMELRPQGSTEGFEGTVAVVEDLGTSYLVSIETSEALVQVMVPEDRPPQMNSHVVAVVDWRRALFYRRETEDLIDPRASGREGAQPDIGETSTVAR